MIRRPLRPSFSYDDKQRLLSEMRTARDRANMFGSAAGYGTRGYKLADDMTRAIDALAAELTGDPAYYHAKPHGR